MFKSELIDYRDGNVQLEAYCAYEDTGISHQPLVLVCHDWSGRNAFAEEKANQLAKLGYVGFALDMYGKGKLGQTKEEKSALIQPFMQNRTMLYQRIHAALDVAKKLAFIDSTRIAAIGFCFGGLCVLDLARGGADLRGVVSFHGLLQSPPGPGQAKPISAKILALHGYNDPMATMDQVATFAAEMNQAKADWQLNMYGQTQHAFMNPEANDPHFGTVYNPRTEKRAFAAMRLFLEEVFA